MGQCPKCGAVHYLTYEKDGKEYCQDCHVKIIENNKTRIDTSIITKDKKHEEFYNRYIKALYYEKEVSKNNFEKLKKQKFSQLSTRKKAILCLERINIEEHKSADKKNVHAPEKITGYTLTLKTDKDKQNLKNYEDFKQGAQVSLFFFKDIKEAKNTTYKGKFKTKCETTLEGEIINKRKDNTIIIEIKGDNLKPVNENQYINVLLNYNAAKFNREKQALKLFCSDKYQQENIRELIIKKILPENKGYIANKKFVNQNPTGTQKKAVNKALNAFFFYAIHGPPGTGKTYTLVEIILQQLKIKDNSRILVCSDSNNATENILNELKNRYKKFERDEPNYITRFENSNKEIDKKKRVIFCTNNYSHHLKKNNYSFDLLIIDEITQSTLPSCLIPITQSKKVIICGDHHQLPPYVDIRNEKDKKIISKSEKLKYGKILSESLFEKVYELIKNQEEYYIFLKEQFRLEKEIIAFLNKTIYLDTKLEYKKTKMEQTRKLLFKNNLVFINTDEQEEDPDKNLKSYFSEKEHYNLGEVEIVKKIIGTLLKKEYELKNIGIMSPYKSQKRELNKMLKKEFNEEIAKTIDGYQGQEKEIVIVSLVRSNNYDNDKIFKKIGFLTDERRLNVALSRSENQLIIIGNKETLTLNNKKDQTYYDEYENKNKKLHYKELIEHIEKNGRYIEEKNLNRHIINFFQEHKSADKKNVHAPEKII